MAEKPILFNTDMVKAILEGRKTVTRRIIKTDKTIKRGGMIAEFPSKYAVEFDDHSFLRSPIQPDDILWVRETWRPVRFVRPAKAVPVDFREKGFEYRADGFERSDGRKDKWRPSIHMPRAAARLFLRTTDVRIERLQDMTEEDAICEGYDGMPWCYHHVFENYPDSPIPCDASSGYDCPPDRPCDKSIPELFGETIWNSTIKKSDLPYYGWGANPWVWVIEFERMGSEVKA